MFTSPELGRNEDAERGLIVQHWVYTMHYARKRASRSMGAQAASFVEDITQQVWLELWQRHRILLLSVSNNELECCVNKITQREVRARKKRALGTVQLLFDIAKAEEFASQFDERTLSTLMCELSAHEQVTFALIAWGTPRKDIAELFGITAACLNMRIKRIINKLRKLIADRHEVSTDQLMEGVVEQGHLPGVALQALVAEKKLTAEQCQHLFRCMKCKNVLIDTLKEAKRVTRVD